MAPSLLDSSAGAFLLASFLSSAATGVTTFQAFNYFSSTERKREAWVYNAVIVLLILDWIMAVMSVVTPYNWLVDNFGNPEVLEFTPWSFNLELAATGIVASIVQKYYAYRIHILSKRQKFIPCLVLFLAVVSLAFCFATTIQAFILRDVNRFQVFSYGVITWLVVSASTDILITVAMVYFLKNHQSDFASTNSIIDTILKNVIQTGALTSLVALINAIVFATMPSLGWHALPNLLLSKLYFNSLLVTLNSRSSMINQINNGQKVSEIKGIQVRDEFGSTSRSPISLSVDISKEIKFDEEIPMGEIEHKKSQNSFYPPTSVQKDW